MRRGLIFGCSFINHCKFLQKQSRGHLWTLKRNTIGFFANIRHLHSLSRSAFIVHRPDCSLVVSLKSNWKMPHFCPWTKEECKTTGLGPKASKEGHRAICLQTFFFYMHFLAVIPLQGFLVSARLLYWKSLRQTLFCSNQQKFLMMSQPHLKKLL